MWAKVAEEMQVPWRAAEAMHWQIGESDMARRAGVVPFSLSSASSDPPGSHPASSHQRVSPSRSHHHSQSQGSLPSSLGSGGAPSPHYGRGGGPPPVAIPPPPGVHGRALATRRDNMPPRAPEPSEGSSRYYGQPGPGLAPIQTGSQQGRGPMLPGVAELTTGVSPYNTPAYAAGVSNAPPAPTQSPGPLLPALGYPSDQAAGKRRASPDLGPRDPRDPRRRYLDPRYDDGGESSRR
jgi:hypothetical protein